MKQYYICYPEGKFKALTFSYDDGKKSDRHLIELFNKYKLKGTFHLNGGLIPQIESEQSDVAKLEQRILKEDIKNLYAGHEVAAHTATHPTIERCPLDKVVMEVLEDRKILENLVKYPVRGLSYPNGSYTQAIKNLLPALGIDYSRVVGDTRQFGLPKDWYEWTATCHHNHRLLELGKEFIDLHKQQYLYLMYVWGHSYEFDRDNNWELMEQFAKSVSGREDTWYATNHEIYQYLEDARKLQFSAAGDFVYNPTATDIWIRVGMTPAKVASGKQVTIG